MCFDGRAALGCRFGGAVPYDDLDLIGRTALDAGRQVVRHGDVVRPAWSQPAKRVGSVITLRRSSWCSGRVADRRGSCSPRGALAACRRRGIGRAPMQPHACSGDRHARFGGFRRRLRKVQLPVRRAAYDARLPVARRLQIDAFRYQACIPRIRGKAGGRKSGEQGCHEHVRE